MGAGSHDFGYSVGEGTEWIDMENRIRVFAVVYTALRENDGYKVDTGRAKERKGGRFGK